MWAGRHTGWPTITRSQTGQLLREFRLACPVSLSLFLPGEKHKWNKFSILGTEASGAPLPLPWSFLPWSRPPSCSSLSSPDGVKEAIASLVLPADSLLASTWISCSAGFFKLGRIFSVLHGRIWNLIFNERVVEFGVWTRSHQCKVWAPPHLIPRNPHKKRREHLAFLEAGTLKICVSTLI